MTGPGRAVNTDHTVKYVPSSKANTIKVAGVSYQLDQMHFHSPAENIVNGQQYSDEFHFVHESSDGKVAVVALFATPGAENAAWQPFRRLPPICRSKSCF